MAADNFRCEKCAGKNILSKVDVEREFENRSDDEYPQVVVESLKIGGGLVTANVCLECGYVELFVDTTPLQLQIKHKKEEYEAHQARQKEEAKIRVEYSKMVISCEELEKEIKKLMEEDQKKWNDNRNKLLFELAEKSQVNETKMGETKFRLKALVEDQQRKQQALKALGISPSTNPDVVKKLIDEYEALTDLVKLLESEKKELDNKTMEIRNQRREESKIIGQKNIELDKLKGNLRSFSQKYPFVRERP